MPGGTVYFILYLFSSLQKSFAICLRESLRNSFFGLRQHIHASNAYVKHNQKHPLIFSRCVLCCVRIGEGHLKKSSGSTKAFVCSHVASEIRRECREGIYRLCVLCIVSAKFQCASFLGASMRKTQLLYRQTALVNNFSCPLHFIVAWCPPFFFGSHLSCPLQASLESKLVKGYQVEGNLIYEERELHESGWLCWGPTVQDLVLCCRLQLPYSAASECCFAAVRDCRPEWKPFCTIAEKQELSIYRKVCFVVRLLLRTQLWCAQLAQHFRTHQTRNTSRPKLAKFALKNNNICSWSIHPCDLCFVKGKERNKNVVKNKKRKPTRTTGRWKY